MKTIVAVCVYDRFENISEWINCWKQCDTKNAELIIIHNYASHEDVVKFKSLCDDNNITYISRVNKGYDIGAFMDVCQGKITILEDCEYLLWCTDDTIPMSKDFIARYIRKMKDGIGVVCMDIATYPEVRIPIHFRTTGFMIRKSTALLLRFPEEIKTKVDCYMMEYEGENYFYKQITGMNLRVLMVDTPEKSPMWDKEHSRRGRSKEHRIVFPII